MLSNPAQGVGLSLCTPEFMAEAAVATPPPMTLREHIAAEEPAKALPGAAPVVAPVVDATPDPDVESNPDLAKEIDALEAPKPEETPQERAARTKRHKASAQKGLVSRLAHQRDKERERASNLEKEVLDLRRRFDPTPAAKTGQPQPKAGAPAYDGSHPGDPEPTDEQFATAPDPWLAKERAHADWRARKELRKVEVGKQQHSLAVEADTRRTTALRAFDTHANELRKVEPGFDAAIEHLNLTPPMQAVIFGSGELGPHIALALAKDPATYQRIVALPPQGQLIELGAIKATVGAARAKAAESPIPRTQAPAPPSALAGGVAAAAEPDTRKGVPLKDHIRIEEAEIADRKKRGYRY